VCNVGVARILCVDDRRTNLLALRAAFALPDYEVVDAESGAEALALTEKFDFAVILLDVQMPVMDGFQTAKLIRQTARSKNTPIIFLTANYPNEQHALLGYEAGAVDYLFKPFNIEVLRAKVAVFVDLFRTKVDIKHLQEAERALKQAVQVRDDFLSIASHELKTPITPLQLQIQGFIRMIETGSIATTPPEKLKHMLAVSDSQVSRLGRLIEQLLDISRINEGRLDLQLQTTNFAEVVRVALEALVHEIEASECKLILDLDPNIEGTWDKFRLEQVVINLLANAMKYGCGRPIRILLSRHQNQARFAVIDAGIGIAKEDHLRIFERFERAVPNRNYGGLGLGLYISRQIVEFHRGTIAVESAPGQGAVFTVELPLIPQS